MWKQSCGSLDEFSPNKSSGEISHETWKSNVAYFKSWTTYFVRKREIK